MTMTILFRIVKRKAELPYMLVSSLVGSKVQHLTAYQNGSDKHVGRHSNHSIDLKRRRSGLIEKYMDIEGVVIRAASLQDHCSSFSSYLRLVPWKTNPVGVRAQAKVFDLTLCRS